MEGEEEFDFRKEIQEFIDHKFVNKAEFKELNDNKFA